MTVNYAKVTNTFPPEAPNPLPVDPSDDARDEPMEEDRLLALFCWLVLLLLL